jgi:ssDNA-binding Zn-finger/Zn-ribbon topoisomerase 1
VPAITRECPRCGNTKDISEFTWRKGHGRDNYDNCKACDDELWSNVNTSDLTIFDLFPSD